VHALAVERALQQLWAAVQRPLGPGVAGVAAEQAAESDLRAQLRVGVAASTQSTKP
jgi:hypothetical protein